MKAWAIRISTISLLLVAVACGGAQSTEGYGNTPEEAFYYADGMHKEGDIEGARAGYAAALSMDADYHDARYQLALLYNDAGDVDGAVQELKYIVGKNPAHIGAQILLGEIYLKRGQADAALVAADAALSSDVDLTPGIELRARALEALKRVDEAIVEYEQLVDRDPDNDALNLRLAKLLVQQDESRAIEILRKYVDFHGNDVDTRVELAELYMKRGQFDNARDVLRPGTEIDRNHAKAHLLLGKCLLERAAEYDAVTVLQRAIKLDSKDPRAHIYLGQAYLGAGQPQKALAEAQIALELQPDYIPAVVLQASYYHRAAKKADEPGREGDRARAYKKAISFLEQAREKAPQNKEVLTNLAQVYTESGDAAKAAEAIEPLLKDPEVSLRLQKVAADAYQLSNKPGKAIQTLASAYERHGDLTVLDQLVRLAILHPGEGIGRTETVELAEKLHQSRLGGQIPTLMLLVDAYVANGEKGKARTILKSARDTFGRNPELRRKLRSIR